MLVKTANLFAMSLLLIACASTGQSAQNEITPLDDLGYQAILEQDWAAAEKQLNAAIAENPEDPFRLLNLAYVLRSTGRHEEAAEVYQKVLQLSDNPLAALPTGHGKRVKRIAKDALASFDTSQN